MLELPRFCVSDSPLVPACGSRSVVSTSGGPTANSLALDTILRPRAVVVVGATDDPVRIGGRVFAYLQHGFEGPVYAVNPRRTTVQGELAYPTPQDTPPADLAVIAVPADQAAQALESCGLAGIPWAVVLASGFSEVGAAGREREAALLSAARTGGVRLIGPNSVGLVNVANGMTATFASRLAVLDLRPGGVAIVTQSGATGSALLSEIDELRIPCSVFCHTGNEADVTLWEVVEGVVAQPETECVGVYLESVRDPARLVSALAGAALAGKPVVVLRAGRTPAGTRAATSHTGAMLREDSPLSAMIEALGAVQVDSMYELVDTVAALSRRVVPTGRRLAVVTVSGGGGVIQADAATAAGFHLPTPSDRLGRQLKGMVSKLASVENPFDLTGDPINRPEVLEGVVRTLSTSREYDVLSLHLSAGERAADALTRIVGSRHIADQLPRVVTWQAASREVRRRLNELDVPTYDDPSRAVAALGRTVSWYEARGETIARVPALLTRMTPHEGHDSVPLDMVNLGTWLARRGVALVPTVYVSDQLEVDDAWAKLGDGPKVVKLVGKGVVHRTDMGGIRLGVTSTKELHAAVAEILAAGARHRLSAPLAQVQPQLNGQVELLVGLRSTTDFGWMLALGLGGTLAEIIREVRVLPAPTTETDCLAALTSLFDGRLVSHPRGMDPRAAEVAAMACARFSELARLGLLGASALEVNPLLVSSDSALAADWVAVG